MNHLEITAVDISPVHEGPPELLAFASVIINGALKVTGLRVIQRHNDSARFVAMPSRRHKDGSFHDVTHPINREARAYMEETVLNAYQSALTSGIHYIIPKATHLA